MTNVAKLLILLGAALLLAGIVLLLVARLHLPLGRLPGDILYRGRCIDAALALPAAPPPPRPEMIINEKVRGEKG